MMATALKIVDRGPDKVIVECPECGTIMEISSKDIPYNGLIEIDFENGRLEPSYIVCPNDRCRWADYCHLPART